MSVKISTLMKRLKENDKIIESKTMLSKAVLFFRYRQEKDVWFQTDNESKPPESNNPNHHCR